MNLEEPISRAKWLSEKTIVAATTCGNVIVLQVERDAQNVECLSRPRTVYATMHGVAIWDLVALSSGQMLEVWLAEDSGTVTQLRLDSATLNVTQSSPVHVSHLHLV